MAKKLNKRGIALLLSFTIILVLTGLSAAIVSRSVSERNFVQRYTESIQAFWLAEAGINHAVNELSKNYNWAGTTKPVSLGKGEYEAIVTEGADSSSRNISVTSYVPNKASSRIERKLETLVSLDPLPPFCWAIFGDTKVKVGGAGVIGNAVIDSYDSSKGDYFSQRGNKWYANTNADVGTNNTKEKSIDISGANVIYGELIVGPKGNPETAISITGRSTVKCDGYGAQCRKAAQEKTALPEVEIPAGLKNSGDLKLTNDRKVLPSGSYWYSSIELTGRSDLIASGKVTIYVDHADPKILGGDVKISGGSMMVPSYSYGQTQKPSDLTVIVLGDGDEKISISTKLPGDKRISGFIAGLYAPKSNIEINGAGIYGAMIAKEVDLKGSSHFHYDEALNPGGGRNPAKVTVKSWKDIDESKIEK